MLKASGAMAAATLFSRVLGLVRERSNVFYGHPWVNDAFQYAFTFRICSGGCWAKAR